MRILMIIDGLPGGSAEKVVLTLCGACSNRGMTSVSSAARRLQLPYPVRH